MRVHTMPPESPMLRTYVLSIVLCAIPLAIACGDDAAEMQRTADKAQVDANTAIAAARTKADQEARNAQAEADKKIAAMEANFTTLREDYRHTVTLNLVALDKKIADLKARAKKANGKEKAGLEARVAAVEAKYDAFTKDYSGLDTTVASSWDATRARLDAEWTELERQVDAT